MQKRKQRRKRSYIRRPKRIKTLEEILELKEDEIWVDPETGIVLILEDNTLRYFSCGELLIKFYERNKDLFPIIFQLVSDLGQAWAEKDWYAIMYGGWHIRIIKGPSTEGPHQTQLWFKSQSMGPQWIASLQLMAFFYNEIEVKTNLLKSIEDREFFMSDEDKEKSITI